jgi:hypothetical protein
MEIPPVRLPISRILFSLSLGRRIANVRVHYSIDRTNRRQLCVDFEFHTNISITIMLSIHSRSVDLEGVPTEIMVQAFADRVLILVTQMGKVGNLVHL